MRQWLRLGPLGCVLVALGAALAWPGGAGAVATAAPPDGEALYVTGCSGCHGLDGTGLRAEGGSRRGPDLTGSGEAGAYFYLSTGRMPLADPTQQPVRKDPAYAPDEIDALITYVGALGDGPPIPAVDARAGDLATGGETYRAQCAACHSATGAGGALSYGRAAPPLDRASARQVAAAVRIGPGQMPVFSEEAVSDEDLDGVARYVQYLREPDNRGGLSLGGLGPVPEGFLVWVVGTGGLLAISGWIAHRSHRRAEATGP